MIRFLIFLMLISTSAFAGQVVCSDGAGKITGYEASGQSITGCLYYDYGQTTTQAQYDAVKTLFQTVPQKYIHVVLGSPIEMTAAEKAIFDSAAAASQDAALRTEAKAQELGFSSIPLFQRAIAQTLIDEINSLRQWITDFKAATAAATNLADFKIRVAALSNMPARTLAQAKTSVESNIDSGTLDNA